jgi:hypothetical protein
MKAFFAIFVVAAAIQLASAGVPLVNGTCPSELCPSIGSITPKNVDIETKSKRM